MSFENKTQYQSRPSTGAAPAKKSYGSSSNSSTGSGGTKKPAGKRPTHYLKDTNKNFVNHIGVWLEVDKFGTDTFQIKVNESLEPGTYFMKAVRTDKEEQN